MHTTTRGTWDVTAKRTITLPATEDTIEAVVADLHPTIADLLDDWEDIGDGYLRAEFCWTCTVTTDDDLDVAFREHMQDDMHDPEGFELCEFGTQFVEYDPDDFYDC